MYPTVTYMFDKLQAFRILTLVLDIHVLAFEKITNFNIIQIYMYVHIFISSSFFIQTILIVFLFTFCKFICIYFWISYLKIELEQIIFVKNFSVFYHEYNYIPVLKNVPADLFLLLR